MTDLAVDDDNCDEWMKVPGKNLRKFYKLDFDKTELRIPKSNQSFSLSVDVNAVGMII